MTTSRKISCAVCGVGKSSHAVRMTSLLFQQGFKPDYLLIQDNSLVNVANTLHLLQTRAPFPFCDTLWEKCPGNSASLVSLGLLHQIPFYCFSSFAAPSVHALLKTHPVDVVVSTDCPVLRGPFLHLPTFGVLSVHAATLPYFRGNLGTAFNLYMNEPLIASAFFMTPRINEGTIVGRARIPVHPGDQLAKIVERSIKVSADLVAQVIDGLEAKSVGFFRQQPWQGTTFRSTRSADGVWQSAISAEMQRELAIRLGERTYGHYENDRA